MTTGGPLVRGPLSLKSKKKKNGGYRRKGEGGRILVVKWAIWLHRNEVKSKGRPVCTDSVVHKIEGMMASWAH